MLSNSPNRPRTPDQLSTGCCYSVVISSQRGMTIAHDAQQLLLTMECLSPCSCPRNKQGWGLLYCLWNCSYSLVEKGVLRDLNPRLYSLLLPFFPSLTSSCLSGRWFVGYQRIWHVKSLKDEWDKLIRLGAFMSHHGCWGDLFGNATVHKPLMHLWVTLQPTVPQITTVNSLDLDEIFSLVCWSSSWKKKRCFFVFFKKKWYKNMDFISDHEDHILSRMVAWNTFERARRERKKSSTKWRQVIPLWLLLKRWEHWSCSYKGRGDESKMKIRFIHCWTMSNGNESSDIRGSGKAGEEMSLSERKWARANTAGRGWS